MFLVFLGQVVLLAKKGSLDLKKNFLGLVEQIKKISASKPKVAFFYFLGLVNLWIGLRFLKICALDLNSNF